MKTQLENIGYCQGLCGGLMSHHLVDGLCPCCRKDKRIHSSTELNHEDILGIEAEVTSSISWQQPGVQQ